MATFNIYGCCICRDLFGFTEDESGFSEDKQHEILQFLQSSSQFVNFIYPTKPKREMTDKDLQMVSSIEPFKKKCIINDYNKTLLDYYVKAADYFIIDLINIAATNLMKEISEDDYVHYFTESAWFLKAYEDGLEAFFSESTLKAINRLDLIKQIGIDEVLNKMIQWLTETLGYREEQIILIENKRATFYTDGEVIYFFNPGTTETVNTYMDQIYKSFEEKCPGCHVIKPPYGSYADSRHPWELTDLHYTRSYYEYLYDCVNAIINNQNSKQEIDLLHEEYSKLNEKNISILMKNTIDKLKEGRLLAQ